MKHIVLVIGNYKNGGVAMRSTNLANAFAQKGYNVTILVTKEIAKNIFFFTNQNVEIVSLDDYVKRHLKNPQIVSICKKRYEKIRFFKTLRYLTRFCRPLDKKIEYEISKIRHSDKIFVYTSLHPNSVYIAFGLTRYSSTFFALSKKNRKIIYAECNASEFEFPPDPVKRQRMIDIVCDASGVVLQTKGELEFYNGKLRNFIVINNPVKSHLPEPYTGERRKVIANFCRISPQKNLPLLFEAFSIFKKNHSEYFLEIYGNTVSESEANLLNEYNNMIELIGMQNHIKILPARSDVHEVIKDCEMFVSSSDYEGLSNSMIEAMAIGMPCICTDCFGGGAREMITDGENGLLVPVSNVNALAAAMSRMADDKNLQKKCSQNAAKVRKTHNVETIAGKWIDMIQGIT
ncbi:MAG: glycosyltransferase [Acutalibacteraceae bacterium]|nr:glycosyltransferase [Acutalibacteraceae bacterium]